MRCPPGSRRISVVPLIAACDLFKNNPGLTIAPYLTHLMLLWKTSTTLSLLDDQPIDIKDTIWLAFAGHSSRNEDELTIGT
jgi:hypothetical protein